jgi:D-alanyl-D-alanine carboxypeptidase/D-alanyl-D-alanine-endopeptidase (penicillin-binding protein 4)
VWLLPLAALAIAAAADGGTPATLADRLDRVLNGVSNKADLALVVADADTGTVLYHRYGAVPLKPASVQKLFVTAAALERFGPNFHFETRFYLSGDELWVVGGGDPGFGDERLEHRCDRPLDRFWDDLVAALRGRGLTLINRVVIDDSVFDAEVRHPDWPASQADRWYQAPVGGLNLNDNCLDATVLLRNGGVELKLRPDLPPATLDNRLRRGPKHRVVIRRPADSNVIQVTGTAAGGGALDPVAVGDPTLFFAQALKQALDRRGLPVQGDVVRRELSGTELSSAASVATHRTSLPDVLWRCNTFSQNLFAECVLKSLAAYDASGRRSGTPGSWEAGRSVLTATLAQLGIDTTGAVLRDGSGLSHENAATAAQFVDLLLRMRRHAHADTFLQSLAEPGKLGSMQRRYDDAALRGRLRGKTGTLAGVHTLAGYITTADGRTLAFALLINGPASQELALRVCRVLATAP